MSAGRVCFFMPSLAGGGAERVTLSLLAALSADGVDVELVVASRTGELRDSVPDGVPCVDLAAGRVLSAVRPLVAHLRRTRPRLLVGVLAHANIVAVVAAALSSVPVVAVQHNTMSLNSGKTRRDRVLPLLSRVALPRAACTVAVSDGVAEDLRRVTRLPADRVRTIPNVIDYDRIEALAGERSAVTLPAGDAPLVVAAGRLTGQKGFDVLVDAVATVRRPCRVVILGDGPDRAELERQVSARGLADRVAFAGFVDNPYAVLRQASVFVLSSRWEGLPTVLLEALYFPLRIVSTDCRSGPGEILRGVSAAELVPVDDATALGAAIDRALAAGQPPRSDAWRRYERREVISAFLDVFDAAAPEVTERV